jgi:L-ascorbate metabolism protein UlaG (beta-lactamase superfamily)
MESAIVDYDVSISLTITNTFSFSTADAKALTVISFTLSSGGTFEFSGGEFYLPGDLRYITQSNWFSATGTEGYFIADYDSDLNRTHGYYATGTSGGGYEDVQKIPTGRVLIPAGE